MKPTTKPIDQMITDNIYNRHLVMGCGSNKEDEDMPCSGDRYPGDVYMGKHNEPVEKEDEDMPCETMSPEERVRDAERSSRRHVENLKAADLHKWLEKQVPEMKDLDEIGKLCHFIRSLGEGEFLEICKSNFDNPTARELAGWWENHKFDDRQKGREV